MNLRPAFFFTVLFCLNSAPAEVATFQGLSGLPTITDPYAGVGSVMEKGGNCTGTLVAPYVVLTAAHCVWGKLPTQLGFTLDRTPFWTEKTPVAPVHKILLSPEYRRGKVPELAVNSELELNDLALLLLESLDYGTFPTALLPLSTAPPLFSGRELTGAGYGINENGSHGQYRVLNLILKQLLPLADKDGRLIPSAMMAVAAAPNKSNPCNGDTGGPLIYLDKGRAELVGVASVPLYSVQPNEGDNCVSSLGSIYTNVYPHRDWISAQLAFRPPARSLAAPGINDRQNLWKSLKPPRKGK